MEIFEALPSLWAAMGPGEGDQLQLHKVVGQQDAAVRKSSSKGGEHWYDTLILIELRGDGDSALRLGSGLFGVLASVLLMINTWSFMFQRVSYLLKAWTYWSHRGLRFL